MTTNTPATSPRGLWILTAAENEEFRSKPAVWFSEQAETSYQKQSDFSCFVNELLSLALNEVQQIDAMKIEALLLSIKHLTSSWQDELINFAGGYEALINKLHAAESIVGETA